jgi:exodeoxyribonuclease-5
MVRSVALRREDFAELSAEQAEALGLVGDWLTRKDKQVFRLDGWAGTGKTTVAHRLAGRCAGKVAFGSFTGKAALQMRRAGCAGATTLHRMLYTPEVDAKGRVTFHLNWIDGLAATADLIVCDELSMVNEALGSDLLRMGKQLLVLGDPGQLGPPEGEGFFTRGSPDYFLRQIFRQGPGSGIVELARRVREGGRPEVGEWDGVRVVRRGVLSDADIRRFGAVIVGKNETRSLLNRHIRRSMGLHDELPVIGDRVICTRNDHKRGFLNGEIFKIADISGRAAKGRIKMRIVPEDAVGNESNWVSVRRECFEGGLDQLTQRDLGSGPIDLLETAVAA